MKLLLSWLKEYTAINQPPIEIGKSLTMAGLEVESIEKVSLSFEGIVVGLVKSVEKHPNADKLCIASVFNGSETFQVVCGAPNCRPGLRTAFASVGASLTDDEGKIFKIKNTKIRGVESFGMLCSASELRVSDNDEGIIELPDNLEPGTSLTEVFTDYVFEVAITPNLGHCSSMIGAARELAAVTGENVNLSSVIIKEDPANKVETYAKVRVEDAAGCPRYTCRVIRNLKVGPSPDWLKYRLEACGVRSINNIVDITNYVLLETGHPLHAFDLDKLSGGEIIVRGAKEGEKFITLDEKERTLPQGSLLICDAERPVAIAGIMGGLNSEVSDKTVNVLLESAYFLPSSIRKTSKKLGLMTDASKHFERGTDPNGLIYALDRATMLMQELAQGTVAEGIIDIKQSEFHKKSIRCRVKRVNAILGAHFGLSEIEAIFRRLGFEMQADSQEALIVTIPTYRNDISTEIDLVEEVARVYGYQNFETETPRYHDSQLSHAPIFLFEREMRSRLMASGLQEFLTCDLVSPTILEMLGENNLDQNSIIHVLNPTSIDQSILRPSMLPGLLQVVKYNIDHQNHDISGFEIGKIHYKKEEQFKEQSVAGIILTGKPRPHHWDIKPHSVDFYDLKGIIEGVLKELGIDNVRFKENAIHTFHTGRQAAIFAGTLAVGSLGEVHPRIQRKIDSPQRILYAELNLHDLFQVRKDEFKLVDLPLYPGSERDWTITLLEETPINEVLDTIHSIPSEVIEKVAVVDVYRSDKLGAKKKNVTFNFVYRDWDKTISQETVDAEHTRVTKEVLSALGKVVI